MNLEEALEEIVLLKEQLKEKDDLILNNENLINQFKEKETEFEKSIRRLQDINHNLFTKIDSQFITNPNDKVIENQQEEEDNSFTLSDLQNL